ncbi:LacI family DNA-binding transcriptional regulator [Luteolibacter ambystomatis]|uniref:LacI family DNA-binding transcriptional regulator n=1 Tax=Luteolibacter ambystomatis TaxID=2824561 RepID=A0A975PGV6_9BACT|nr:LacI family DNA-binding transcriptional regulator [Luteolibacter ambystomatis]QUE52661.1 LacI family DNA-binding transcriptional regulator [Luteolibacter ambystomatis]
MIAEKAGVHYSTVSLALNDRPGIPEVTRDHVKKIAEAMGYRPDPLLSALATYRSSKIRKIAHESIAWVDFWPPPKSSRKGFRALWAGASKRAEMLGWKLDEVCAGHSGHSPEEIGRILKARGIEGVLIAPQDVENLVMNLDWSGFSAITMAHTLAQPRLHRVQPHQFYNMQVLMRELFALGYRRPGLCLGRYSHGHTDHYWRAGFLDAQAPLPREDRVPPFEGDPEVARGLLGWFERELPDVIVTSRPEVIIQVIESKGVRVPRDVGVAAPSFKVEDWHPDCGKAGRGFSASGIDISGVDEDFEKIGEAMIDLVVSMIHRHETGVPVSPIHHLIEGRWHAGKTLKRAKSKGRKRL